MAGQKTDLTAVLAGFGGQGILFMGKVIAYGGLEDGREVSWLPSYGPEMRGGTANCSVTISDQSIGSPLVLSPNVLVAMNLPSLEKFLPTVVPGGKVFLDSSLIGSYESREDVEFHAIPATRLAEENELDGLANIILVGKLFEETAFCSEEALRKGIEKSVPPSKRHLIEGNLKAIALGRSYAEIIGRSDVPAHLSH